MEKINSKSRTAIKIQYLYKIIMNFLSRLIIRIINYTLNIRQGEGITPFVSLCLVHWIQSAGKCVSLDNKDNNSFSVMEINCDVNFIPATGVQIILIGDSRLRIIYKNRRR